MEQWCVGKYRYSEVCDCMSLSLFSHISLCCSNQICFPALFFCVVLLSHRSSSLAEIIAVIVCVSVCVCVMEWSGALRWGDGMWNHWHYRSWRVEGVEVVAFPLCPLIDRRTPSTCHIPPHLHPPSSLSVQLSLLRAFVFSPPYFSSSSSSPPPRSSPSNNSAVFSWVSASPWLRGSVALWSTCVVYSLFFRHIVYLYIQDIPYSLVLFISDDPFSLFLPCFVGYSSCLSVSAVKITVAGQDCSDCKKKKKKERGHHKEGKTEWGWDWKQ